MEEARKKVEGEDGSTTNKAFYHSEKARWMVFFAVCALRGFRLQCRSTIKFKVDTAGT